MAITGNNVGGRTFADAFPAAGRSTATKPENTQERQKSEFWLNVGKMVDYPLDTGETEPRLASLPMGIPLDGLQPLPENSSNEAYAAFSALRNDLLEQIMELAKELKPGESIKLKLDVELRRKKDDAIVDRGNEGRRKFDLLG